MNNTEKHIVAATNFFDILIVKIALTILIAIVVSFLIKYIIKFLVGRFVQSASKLTHTSHIDKKKCSKTLVSVFNASALVIIWITALMTIVKLSGIDLTPLMTGAGLFGVVISFGAQSTIRDILAGIFIIAENQYRVGDIISVYSGGQTLSGSVEEITLRITKIRDIDGNLHIIRNGSSEAMTNRTFKYANVNIDLNVAYEADMSDVEKVINQVGEEMNKDEKWSKVILEPIKFLRVDEFEDSTIRVKSLGKVEAAEQWSVAGEFRRRIKIAFDKNNISFPYNQLVVHFDKDEK